MREMVFNHASATALQVDRTRVSEWFRDTVQGMARLVLQQVVENSLRMARALHEIECLPGYSLGSAVQSLRELGHRDEYLFFVKLATKIPLLTEVREELADRFHGCQGRTLSEVDGGPLVLCAITDGISVGLPSQADWDDDHIAVEFQELLDDGTMEDVSEEIDQLSRSLHAKPIWERNLARIQAGMDSSKLWQNRGSVFPDLAFGPAVEEDLQKVAGLMGTVVGKLVALDQSAREWREQGGPAPVWRTHVSPEPPEKMKNAKFRNARTFRSYRGSQEIFEWHARYGDHGRIHLRFDADEREVEIGYIGPHLPV